MRKLLTCLLVLILIFNASISIATPSVWAEKDINKAQELNLLTEDLMTDFQKEITREEFAEMIIKLYEVLSNKIAKPIDTNPFHDTNNLEILKAYNLGIVAGIGKGEFAPNNTITREQIAVMYYRTLDAIDLSLLDQKYAIGYDDKGEISNWATEAIGFMSAKGVIGGVGNNRFNPHGTATREQAIALTVRTYTQFNKDGSKDDTVADNKDESKDDTVVDNKDTKRKLTSQEIGELSDSVVKIIVEGYDGKLSTGSGFFFEYGMVATNYHVVEGAKKIELEYEDGSYYKDVVFIAGYDKELDIATLSVREKKTTPIEIGDSGSLKKGQKVYAIGSPDGLKNTLSDGLISALRSEAIQITAPIYFGSSGGVLLDEYGKAIGITSSGRDYAENIGFAIPISYLKSLKRTNNITIQDFYNLTHGKLSIPQNVKAVASGSGDILLYWDNMNADYYVVYDSVNGNDWKEIVDNNGRNKWNWSQNYCLTISGYNARDEAQYAVASVKGDVLSEYAFSNRVILSPKLSDYELKNYLNTNSLFITRNGLSVMFDDHDVSKSSDGKTLYVYTYINKFSFSNYLELVRNGEKDIALEIRRRAREYSTLTGYDIIISLVYSDTYNTYPSAFKENYIYNNTVTYNSSYYNWFVWYPVMELNNYSNYYRNMFGLYNF